MPPIGRLVKMIKLLNRRRRTSLNFLADACKVSSRTVYRDLSALIGLGYAVKNEQGYYLSSDEESPSIAPDNLKLTADDLTLLEFCSEQNPLAGNHSFCRRFQKILGKLRSSSKSSPNNSSRLFQYQTSGSKIKRKSVDRILSKFESALKAKHCISLKLHHARRDAIVLVPIGIKLRRSGVWLVTQEHLKGRTFEYPLVSIKALSVITSPSAASNIPETR